MSLWEQVGAEWCREWIAIHSFFPKGDAVLKHVHELQHLYYKYRIKEPGG